jgi:hypothetical protein
MWVCVTALVLGACSSSGSAKAAGPTTTAATKTTRGTAQSSAEPSSTSSAPTSSSTTTIAIPTTVSTGPPATTPPTTPPTDSTSNSVVTNAVQLVRSKGFTAGDTSDFTTPPPDGLHVLIGTATRSADGYSQQAFFFVRGRFLRTDLADPSAGIHLAWRNGTTIALSYAVYKPNEPMCCPTGGAMIVRYQWNGTRLRVLDPIPSSAARR